MKEKASCTEKIDFFGPSLEYGTGKKMGGKLFVFFVDNTDQFADIKEKLQNFSHKIWKGVSENDTESKCSKGKSDRK